VLEILCRGDARLGKVEVAKRDEWSHADHASTFSGEAEIVVPIELRPLLYKDRAARLG
jgi:hypothetical protein